MPLFTSRRILILNTMLLPFLLTACDVIDSADISTSGIYMATRIENDGDDLDVEVTLSTSSNITSDIIKLSQGDSLYAVLGSQKKQLKYSNYEYSTSLEYEADTLYIYLERSDYDSATNTYISIPDAIELENSNDDLLISETEPTVSFSYSGPSVSSLDYEKIGLIYESDSSSETYTKLDDIDLVSGVTDYVIDIQSLIDEYNAGKTLKFDLFNVDNNYIRIDVGDETKGSVDSGLKGGYIYHENKDHLIYQVEVTE